MRRDWALVALGVGVVIGYVSIAGLAGAAGFPLDDAWIHQVYARNLGWHGQWAFVSGQPSAGSTAPLWTALMGAGYLLRIDYAIWTHLLNGILLGGLAWIAYRWSGRWWIGILILVEWHLAWAAASGMETILFCGLVLGAWWLTNPRESGGVSTSRLPVEAGCGIVSGLAVWTRPDGLTLLPFIGLAIWSQGGDWALRIKRLGWWLGGAAVSLIPYFVFNMLLSGQLWPNTFFAKQAEYAALRQLPFVSRFIQIYSAVWVGGLLLLLPGVALAARRRWLPLAWVIAFLLSYTLRLPVIYQHARYLIPVIPVLIVIGGTGMADWLQLKSMVTWRRVISRVWVMGLGAAMLAFWVLGVNTLVADNRVINSEMVATARWVAANLPAGSPVAAHDIGALGYFAEVDLLDLAGLVSPEVIPFLGDEAALWQFVQQRGAQYLITYPGWCPGFTRSERVTAIFQTGPLCDPASPNLHMAIYAIGP